MRVLGIDPGYQRLGISILEKENGKEILLYSDCFETSKDTPHEERLFLLGKEVERVCKKMKPDTLAIETLLFNKNQKTVMGVSEARGVIMYVAKTLGLEIFEYTPLQIKTAVAGYGRADKRQVIDMVQKLIKIDKIIKHDDEFDAIAVGITCLATETSIYKLNG